MCAVFVSILTNSSYAQSVDNFKTYTNNDLNFTIQHPSNWQVKEIDETVLFELTGRSLPIFAVNTEKAGPHLDSDTMTLKNISLQELAEHELVEMTSSEFRNFDLIKQNKVTIGGNDGWKMEFAGEDSLYLFEICTIAHGNSYTLRYQDKPLKVPETLLLVNKMVESFQVNTADEDTSNNSTFEAKSNNSTFEDYQNKNCPPMSLVLCSEPRCPNGYHRSPDGDCEPARDMSPELGK
jgi:hypothetical protein